MHENRHFLSYRKRRHDAENHVHICALCHSGASLQNGQQAQGNRPGKKNPVRISKDEAPTPLSVVGPLFPPCYCIFLEPYQVRGVSVLFGLFTLAFTTRAGPHQGDCLLLGVLFSQFILICFIICKNEKVLFVLVQQTSDFVASLGQGLGLGQLPVLAIHCFFSWLALLFLEIYRSFTMYE